MIVPRIDDHVVANRHVAGNAAERRASRLVPGVLGVRIFLGRMALQAGVVAGKPQLGAVRIVAIAAGDARGEHLALLERAVIIDFVALLAVGVIEPAGDRRNAVRVGQRPSGNPIFGKRAAARMAEPAGLDLLAHRGGRDATLRISGRRIKRPGDIPSFVEAHDEALGGIVASSERPPALPFPRPIDMTRAAAVTGLAADADFCPGRGEAILRRVVVLVHAGRVALGAHEVPVLVQLGPVQEIVVADFFVRIEVKPTLAPLVFRAAVPGDGEGLQSSIGKFDQVLLQRIEAERVLDLEHAELAVRPVGLDQEFSVLAEEARAHAVVVKVRVVEIAEHRLVGRVIHGVLVLRRSPKLRFRLMAPGAGLAADESGRNRGGGGRTLEQGLADVVGKEKRRGANRDDGRRCRRYGDPDPPPR